MKVNVFFHFIPLTLNGLLIIHAIVLKIALGLGFSVIYWRQHMFMIITYIGIAALIGTISMLFMNYRIFYKILTVIALMAAFALYKLFESSFQFG